jgi:adenine-specific DNA-methyltransferase
MPSLNFKGKALVQNYHLLVPFHELKPVKAKSLTAKPSLHDNLVVHGDNLKALKALLPYYHGAVKCIYIDPPYNTGNEAWVYNDNVNSPMMQEWLGKIVDREDLTRHDKWLCMMMPRVKLMREFLTDDGVICISIDDNEVHWLRALMDEVFGEGNFVATIIWEKVYSPKSSARFFSENHDYILVYARRKESFELGLLPRTEEANARYENPDKDKRGAWKPGDLSARNPYSKGVYAIKCPAGRVIKGPPPGNYWRVSEENLWRLHADNRIWWGEDRNQVPAIKRFLTEVKQGLVPETIWSYKEVGHTQDAKRSLLEIFGDEFPAFTTTKPVELLKRIIRLSTEDDSIVMDAFGGTGTTAQALLEMNKGESATRRFLLIESEDYADSLTAERVRRVINGVPKAKDPALQKGLGGTFTFVEVGNPMHMESLLKGNKLPGFEDLAGYVFYTATGEDFDERAINKKTGFIGTSARYDVYLLYEPDLDYLKNTALTLDMARALPKGSGKPRLVFAPTKYLDSIHLEEHRIDFCQLPFEIYKAIKPKKA